MSVVHQQTTLDYLQQQKQQQCQQQQQPHAHTLLLLLLPCTAARRPACLRVGTVYVSARYRSARSSINRAPQQQQAAARTRQGGRVSPSLLVTAPQNAGR